jgi:hypothetical protein
MHGYLNEHPGVFDPEEVRILVSAFEKAWASLQASGAVFDTGTGAVFDTGTKAASARTILAKHIIAAAKQGPRGRPALLLSN